MTNKETQVLEQELEQFQKEQQKIRNVIGAIGGTEASKRDKQINLFFVVLLSLLFVLDLLRHLLHLPLPLPPLFSLELGILLVSLKIIWMIHKQSKVEHFQFWILNSIEFRINELSNQLKRVEKKLKENGSKP
ncbi:MAG: hypothetical protein K8S27_11895 [Candidatus Omnitrophica bacterium]|nr:hypothetical protein [Candidatus Omnitrophota bacterium]